MAKINITGLPAAFVYVYCVLWRTGPVKHIHRRTLPSVRGYNKPEAIMVWFRVYRAVKTYKTFLGYSLNRTGMVVETIVRNFNRLDALVCTVGDL